MSERDASHQRSLLHRALLSDLGMEALRTRELIPLLQYASRIVAEGMGVRLCKILEYQPERNALLVRAGVGWHDGVVGHAELSADEGSPAGFAYKTGMPVISNDLVQENRFRTPQLLLDHGIRRAMNVLIRGDDVAYGVLETDSPIPGTFDPEETAFMQAASNLLGVAIERWRRINELEGALATHELLLREADHRIKNSLQMVASLLSLQRSRLSEGDALDAIESAISRVSAVAQTHRALNRSADLRTINFSEMLQDLCVHTSELNPRVAVHCTAPAVLMIDAERAIPLGLIVSELLTNASRHAYPGDAGGTVQATASQQDDTLVVELADGGVGMPADEPAKPHTLGSTIIRSFARRIGAAMEVGPTAGGGTTVRLRLGMGTAGEPLPPDP